VTDESSWDSVTRKTQLIDLLNDNITFNEKTLQEVMEKSIHHGGALTELTIFQIIFSFSTNTLLIRKPYFDEIGRSTWTRIELDAYFKQQEEVPYQCGTLFS
jgi:hypothetical protein